MMSKVPVQGLRAAKKTSKAAGEAMDGEDISRSSQELDGHVDDLYDGHNTSLEGVKDYAGKMFTKLDNRVTDQGAEVDEGFVEEAGEAFVSGVKAVSEHLANSEVAGKVGEVIGQVGGAVHDAVREGVGIGAEAIHGAARAVNAGCGVESQGMPEVKDSTEVVEEHADAFKSRAEEVGKTTAEGLEKLGEVAPRVMSVVDPAGTMEEHATALTKNVGSFVAENIAEVTLEVVEETAEAVAESIPLVGAAVPSYSLTIGTVKVSVAAGGLVVAGGASLYAVLVGLVAARCDRGAAWGRAMEVCRKLSAWSTSVCVEGLCNFATGMTGFLNQVPGCQFATIPAKFLLKRGAKAVKARRNSSPSQETIPRRVDDFEGAITQEMVQVGKEYQLVSRDGKNILRASNKKSRRGYQWWLRHRGFSLTFEDLPPAETEEKEENASSFSFSGSPGAYHLHSGLHNNNTLFFMGATFPAEWVVWGVEGKTAGGAWETLEFKWQQGGKYFKILGHGGQYAEWSKGDGVFKGRRSEETATDFVLKEKKSG
ncbi:unnamed protein product [Scytosiphon promiscuus]